MRKLAVLAVLVAAACASQSTNAKAPVTEPEIGIEQISNVPLAAKDMGTMPLTVQFRVAVRNVAQQPITLRRVEMHSVGAGAYAFGNTSRPFDVTIAPGETKAVDFFTAGSIGDPTIIGANGPVTVRAVLSFDSPAGSFVSNVTQQVHSASLGG